MYKKLMPDKFEPGDPNERSCHMPRWAYDDGNFIVKIIPAIDEECIQGQIDLINSLHPKKLIHDDWEIIERLDYSWNGNESNSNSFIKYKMTRVPYGFELDKNLSWLENDSNPLSSIYNDMDMYNKHVFPKYIETNLKIFPYCNVDGGRSNILQFDIGDWIIIDWDDCILGQIHDSQYIGECLVIDAVETLYEAAKIGADYNLLFEYYNSTYDVYKKLTYNTVLDDCEINIETAARISYEKLKEINRRNIGSIN